MKTEIVKQAITSQSLFEVLSLWFNDGAGKKANSIKILTAFISGKGIRAITPLIDKFLANGNDVEIIFGTDRGGTDKEAIEQLFFLQEAHASQLTANHFQAKARNSIFHPKLYIYEKKNSVSFIIGSANLTYLGLGYNLESLMLFEDLQRNSRLAKQVIEIWNSFAKPLPPLPANSLNKLTKNSVEKLLKKIPKRSTEEKSQDFRDSGDSWKPLSKVPLPQTNRLINSNSNIRPKKDTEFLVMDILKETRKTQMQLPLPIVENFFGVQRNQSASLSVRIISDGKFTNPIDRTLVKSGQMRRLEMPQIRKLDRPLVVIFIKLSGKLKFAYYLVKRDSAQYKNIDAFLNSNGQQGSNKRRYYISSREDKHSSAIKKIIGLNY